MGSDQVLRESTETEKRSIIKGRDLGLRRTYRGHRLHPMTVDVAEPDPCCKMWHCRIEKTLHGLLNLRRHVPKFDMIDPILSGIWGKGKVGNGISVDLVIELEEDNEAGVCKDGMRRFRENVIV